MKITVEMLTAQTRDVNPSTETGKAVQWCLQWIYYKGGSIDKDELLEHIYSKIRAAYYSGLGSTQRESYSTQRDSFLNGQRNLVKYVMHIGSAPWVIILKNDFGVVSVFGCLAENAIDAEKSARNSGLQGKIVEVHQAPILEPYFWNYYNTRITDEWDSALFNNKALDQKESN